MNYEWYRSFIAIYQTGTVTAAAKQRCLTQPAVSQHLAALEHYTNTTLFIRQARKMLATNAAKRLYSRIIPAIEQLDSLSLKHVTNTKTSLRIGTPISYFQEKCLPTISAPYFNNYQFSITYGQTPYLIQSLKQDQLDLVLATQRIQDSTISYSEIEVERFQIVANASLNLPKGLTLSAKADWLETQNWITLDEDLPIIRRYWQQVFQRRPAIIPKMIIPDLHSALKAIEANIGISVLPDYLLQPSLQAGTIQRVWPGKERISNILYWACLKTRLVELANVQTHLTCQKN